ncbi:hypothetical protein SAV31267_078720 [Streptomyces avermitilis]|uniref:Shikimate dehydrogenase (NADP(+)) n=1 Tax=Streptomyces avermitilis TaxID=33903 RepID=A0A4D4N599_STRAX|nr:hypothetical protein SAV31267_078720 [Streptomyces avermitilis]
MTQDSYLVGLIGSGIGPSLSPALHEREAGRQGLRYHYRLIDIDRLGVGPEAVGGLVRAARDLGFDGLNITHPCKQLVISHLDTLAPQAEALGAVNTVVFEDGRAVGHNTDVTGFAASFARGLPDARLERVVQLGAGGAGAAVAHALLTLGAGHVTVVDALPERAAALAVALNRHFGDGRAAAASPDTLPKLLTDADGIVHATPTGMAAHPGIPLPAELLHPGLWVAEVVYRPWRPNCCAPPARSAAPRSTAAAWPSSRRWTRSGSSPGGNPTACACSPTSPNWPAPRPSGTEARTEGRHPVRTSIATVSLSGSLTEKLTAAARAGFDGVEIFENDLLASPLSPEEIRARCADLGLSIDLYQPMRDIEAVPADEFSRNLRRARHKFELMRRLGADTVLVCSSVSPLAEDDDALAARQLRRLAELAADFGIRVAYEALAWGAMCVRTTTPGASSRPPATPRSGPASTASTSSPAARTPRASRTSPARRSSSCNWPTPRRWRWTSSSGAVTTAVSPARAASTSPGSSDM